MRDDALVMLEQACRPLLRDVEEALATLGAPPAHPVWGLLREVGVLPVAAIDFFLNLDPSAQAPPARQARQQAELLAELEFPVTLGWAGSAGDAYGLISTHLREHANQVLAARYDAVARYADDVARWIRWSRERMARALGEAIGSSQAVTVRSRGRIDPTGTDRVTAAADIAAWVLTAVAESMAAGRAVLAEPRLIDEAAYVPPDLDLPPDGGPLHVPR